MNRVTCILIAATLLVDPREALAHSMGVVYNLPLPFWIYAFAASATLALSFLVVGFFVSGQAVVRDFRSVRLGVPCAIVPAPALWIGRALSVFLLLLTLLTALFGTSNPFANFSVTFFWIMFVLGLAYLTPFIGDIYALVNPWRVLCDWIDVLHPGTFRARCSYPRWLAYYPALGLYMAFIWLELFGHASPRALGIVLAAYTVLTIGAAAVFGIDTWFRHGELFAVFFRLIGKISPIEYQSGTTRPWGASIRLRWPFIGLIEDTADHPSLLLFVLFMLSSTAFDGLHETLPWVRIFWKTIYPGLATLIHRPYLFFVDVYYNWQWGMLFVSPFVYLGIYLFFVWLMKVVTKSPRALGGLALHFAYCLIPIAFVYNVVHYYTLLVSDAPAMLRLISDPFGVGWNLFGTALNVQEPIVLLANGVWHTQIALILFGHIVSVYLAHAEALRLFQRSGQALRSQLPMLILMVAFTTVGLWILSLPIAAGQVQDPAQLSSRAYPSSRPEATAPLTSQTETAG
jgi:hypothetical protein